MTAHDLINQETSNLYIQLTHLNLQKEILESQIENVRKAIDSLNQRAPLIIQAEKNAQSAVPAPTQPATSTDSHAQVSQVSQG